MQDDLGGWLFNRQDIGNFLITKFTNLYRDEGVTSSPPLADFFQTIVTRFKNFSISALPTKLKIMETLKSMNPHKAPRAEGMPGLFFEHYWNIVGGDVVKTIQDIFLSDRVLAALNRTTVVLIPKTLAAFLFNHLRLISLCNTIYKIFAKLLASWLWSLLPKLISLNQTACTSGCWIGENTLLVNEVIHYLRRKKGIIGYVGIKFDLHKAYDRVN
ncbi:uncharacterized protein LOC132803527 [Ziziphus jujuba]|uniref:Uncharacterized protein LOC132803527 n=1 Tax=Ziziphus jujuba TaxID=326968 RepID=A0ABM4A7K1_ZIZJJ|nr:uncharacterized protein LOC132803527 [Ziziphus jujuba]